MAKELPGVKQLLEAQDRSSLAAQNSLVPQNARYMDKEPKLRVESLVLDDAYYGLHEDDDPAFEALDQLWEKQALATKETPEAGQDSKETSVEAFGAPFEEAIVYETPTFIPTQELIAELLQKRRASMPSHTTT